MFNKKIKNLDEWEFFIESNKATQPNEVRVITGEGMAVHKFQAKKVIYILHLMLNFIKV